MPLLIFLLSGGEAALLWEPEYLHLCSNISDFNRCALQAWRTHTESFIQTRGTQLPLNTQEMMYKWSPLAGLVAHYVPLTSPSLWLDNDKPPGLSQRKAVNNGWTEQAATAKCSHDEPRHKDSDTAVTCCASSSISASAWLCLNHLLIITIQEPNTYLICHNKNFHRLQKNSYHSATCPAWRPLMIWPRQPNFIVFCILWP